MLDFMIIFLVLGKNQNPIAQGLNPGQWGNNFNSFKFQ